MSVPALLVIDVQKVYCLPKYRTYIDNCVETIEQINKLIEYFREHDRPIIYITHTYEPDGSDAGRMWDYSGVRKPSAFINGTEAVEFPEDLNVTPDGYQMVKHRYSSFVGTNLQETLAELGVDTLVITGFMTNFCCETTARDGHDRDYFVEFISDATSCPKNLIGVEREIVQKVVHASLAAGVAVVKTTEEYLGVKIEN